MITTKDLLEAIAKSQTGENHIDDVVSHLNSNNPGLQFELKLHGVLEASLKDGLTVLEAVGALECVKAHLQNQFYESKKQPIMPQWLQ